DLDDVDDDEITANSSSHVVNGGADTDRLIAAAAAIDSDQENYDMSAVSPKMSPNVHNMQRLALSTPSLIPLPTSTFSRLSPLPNATLSESS
ncbi:hypothetical protein U2060_14840, partial [Listeria monocytogenes]|uniref:hypothetical protein n=1 Tax=Listeria monocytogenes TaxID=1639 RepID=UPI002FDC58F2